MNSEIGIGLVGYGAIGKIHTLCYTQLPLLYPGILPPIELVGVCTSRSATARSASDLGGFSYGTSDLRVLLEDDSIAVIDCSAPNHLHREIILAALQAGKDVYCEKPLALNGREAREIVNSAEAAGINVGMTFNFRFIPALMRAKEMILEGRLGRIVSFRAEYLHTGYQDPNRPMNWKLRKETSGGGALVDLGVHSIDLIRHLLGEFGSVRTTIQTYITERPISPNGTEKEPVTVDDAAWLEIELEDRTHGTLEVSRYATGSLDDLNIDIYGDRGALRFRLMDANWLYWFDATLGNGNFGGDKGWTRLETVQHYPGATIPSPRSILGWTRLHAENQFRFLRSFAEKKTPSPNGRDGLRTQLVLDAAYTSADTGDWVSVEEP